MYPNIDMQIPWSVRIYVKGSTVLLCYLDKLKVQSSSIIQALPQEIVTFSRLHAIGFPTM